MIYEDKKFIGKTIQTIRKKAKIRQSELAEKIVISEKHLSKIETGKNYPALDTFFKIINILNLSLGDFGFNNISETYPNKDFLQKIINTSSKNQIDAYADVVSALVKYI